MLGNCRFLCYRILQILGNRFFHVSWFPHICLIFHKRRAPTFHAELSENHAEISNMRPMQGKKLVQVFKVLLSKWRRRRRRRGRANNAPIWPDHWTIAPRALASTFNLPTFQKLYGWYGPLGWCSGDHMDCTEPLGPNIPEKWTKYKSFPIFQGYQKQWEE